MRKIFLFVAILFASLAWGADISIVPTLQKDASSLSYGLYSITRSNAKFTNGKVEASSNGAEVTLTFTAIKSDMYIKSITFDSPQNGTLSSADGTIVENVFTTEGVKTSVSVKLASETGKKGSVKINNVIVNTGYNVVETWDDFSISDKTVNKTVTVDGIPYTSSVSLTMDGVSASGVNLSISNNGTLTFSSSRNIWYISFVSADDLQQQKLQVGSTTIANNAWSGAESTVTIKNSAGASRNYSKIFVISEPATRSVYLKPNVWVTSGNPERFAVYCFIDNNEWEWYDMTPVDGGCDVGTIYKAEVDRKYSQCIFCRMKGDDPENKWDNKWNQTNDLSIPSGPFCSITSFGSSTVKAGTNWTHTPYKVCISTELLNYGGTYIAFANEPLVIKATSVGATHFQWYKDGTPISGANSATYRKEAIYEDAGTYYCKAGTGEGDEVTSNSITIKMLRMKFSSGRGGGYYGHVDLVNTDPTNHIATGMIYLGENWKYAFCVANGIGNEYGQNNEDNDWSYMSYTNHEGWYMNSSSWCLLKTKNFGTYTFTIDYTNMSMPKVSAAYPIDKQEAGKIVYFDNNVNNWTNLHFRIGYYDGSTDKTYKEEISKVHGTANLYKYETKFFEKLRAWHFANNCGWSGTGLNIYTTNTGDGYAIDSATNYEGGAAIQDITITPVPRSEASKGDESYNNNCYYHKFSVIPGMKTQKVEIIEPAKGGTIEVSYIDVDNNPQSFTTGSLDLAHTCILTVNANPDPCYSFGIIRINGINYTNGSTYIITSPTTIEAVFVENTYNITYSNLSGGRINDIDYPTTYTYGTTTALPMDVTLAGKDFDGWYDNPSCTGSPVTEISDTECGNKTFYANWISELPKVTYILGSCYVKNGMWTPGNDGNVSAWMYIPGATVAENTLKATSDISYTSSNTAGIYFNTKDITKLDETSSWGTSQGGARAIKALNINADETITLNLNSLQAKSIVFYVFPESNYAYSIDLTVNGTTINRAIPAGEQNQWHKYSYRGSVYTGEFSLKSNDRKSRIVVVVEVPTVTITFNKNDGSSPAETTTQIEPKGKEFELDENTFYRTDYIFRGWTENPDGTGTLIPDRDLFTADVDHTLYAKWEEVIKTVITLVATGATNNYTQSVTASYTLPMPEIGHLPVRPGYVFDGYYEKENGVGTKYYSGLGEGLRNWDKAVASTMLYANWVEPCDLVPTLQNVVPIVTIWDRKKVDVGVVKLTCDFDTTGISYSLVSAVPSEPLTGDLHFEYFDEQIHLMGTSNFGNSTTKTITVMFTMKNNCDPEHTYTITSTIRIYPQNQKPKVAFIITGTKDGAFDAYDTDDASACNDLVNYLGTYFDITYVNGYATKDPTDIATYYNNYDLMVVTDFLNTKEGYTNALGTMIDKKPILSFEAYVAKESNWHIASNPKDPSPKVQDMKVLCAGHAVFMDAKYDEEDALPVDVVNDADTTVHVLDALSSAKDAKGLQGFTINEAPDFIFLATIRDANNKRDLIVCCERQVVFSARLMLYGINYYEMGNLSKAGRIIIRQMIDYLLMTDETKVADCSLVFDNGAGNPDKSTCGDNLWSNPANWAPGYNIIPTPYQPARIIAKCHVNYDAAHAGSVKVNKGRDEHNNPVDGKLIIEPSGGLTIAGVVTTVHDTRYASPITIKAEDLLIESDETGNGALVYGNKESDVRATVEYYSLAKDANVSGKKPVWQYIGIPFQSGQTAIQMYYAAWMCRWAEGTTDHLGGLWQWVENDDVLTPFEGYCITQESEKKYTFAGKLNLPTTRTIILDNQDEEKFAFAANSWTAPIKIQEMQDADFINAEKSIYIYHTGSYKNWEDYGTPVSATDPGDAATLPGQYAVIPIHSSPYIAGADSVIPSMQGFFVKATADDARLKLVYNRVVYDSKYFKTSTQPMRAPRRLPTEEPEVMQLIVSGENYGDRVYLLARNDFSEEFEDGWDGRKIAGDEDAPMLSVMKEAGEMAVAAVETAEERELLFRAGEDTEYTFSFDYDGDKIYLYDRLAGKATEIKTGNTYSFTADNETAMPRFLITKNPPQVPTDIEQLDNGQWTMDNARKLIIDGVLYILRDNRFYDARGVRVTELRRKEVTP